MTFYENNGEIFNQKYKDGECIWESDTRLSKASQAWYGSGLKYNA